MNQIDIFRRDHPAIWLESAASLVLEDGPCLLTVTDWITLCKAVLAMHVLRGDRLIKLRDSFEFREWALRWLAAPVKLCQRCGLVPPDGSGIMCVQCWIEIGPYDEPITKGKP